MKGYADIFSNLDIVFAEIDWIQAFPLRSPVPGFSYHDFRISAGFLMFLMGKAFCGNSLPGFELCFTCKNVEQNCQPLPASCSNQGVPCGK